jgi:integrase
MTSDTPMQAGRSKQGKSVDTVAERLGHDDATTVIKTYGHVMPNSEDRTRKAIDEVSARYPSSVAE